ncbi:MAG: hypothetical protein ITF99_08325 [Chryseobacterium sp.]|nr:hypothetical protein [Chryseobacterium sp.]
MKKIFPLSVILVLASCNSGKSAYTLGNAEPIIDYPRSYQENEQMLQIQQVLKQQESETVYLWNGKVMTYKKFSEKMGEKKVKTVKMVTSPDEINALGFDNTKVKKIMVATN